MINFAKATKIADEMKEVRNELDNIDFRLARPIKEADLVKLIRKQVALQDKLHQLNVQRMENLTF